MIVRKLIAGAVAVLALLALAGGARAEVTPSLPQAPVLTMTGTLEYFRNLETPHYELDGWAIIAPDQAVLSLLAGKEVTVTGQRADSMSILMRRRLAVTSLTTVLEGRLEAVDGHFELDGWIIRGLQSEVQAFAGAEIRLAGAVVWRMKGPPTMEALGIVPLTQTVPAPTEERTLELIGVPRRVASLESPHWELNGYVLTGLTGELEAFSDRHVQITGSVSQEMSIYMKPVLRVLSLSLPAAPQQIIVTGVAPNLPAPAAYSDGYLMLPLRAVVEAAGGMVAWDPVFWAVRVSLGDRSTTIRIGSAGTLAVAPYLQDGHTMAPLALFEQLGLRARWTGTNLFLDSENS